MNASLQSNFAGLDLQLPSTEETTGAADRLLEELNAELSIREDVYGNILIALSEALNNAVRHGNAFAQDKQVHVQASMAHAFRLRIVIEDQGPGFDPDALPDPTLPENLLKESGRGVFVMRQLADSLVYEQEGRRAIMEFDI